MVSQYSLYILQMNVQRRQKHGTPRFVSTLESRGMLPICKTEIEPFPVAAGLWLLP